MKIFTPSIILAVAAALLSAPAIEAQDRSVTWTRTTQIDVPGDLGTLLRAIPGGLNAGQSEHGIHLSGRKVRQDDGSGSMIIDLDERRWASLDHDARMFTAMSFDQSIEMARQMAAGMEGEMEEAQAEWRAAIEESREEREAMMAEMREAMAEVGEELALDIDVRQTGETRSFDGFNATRRMVIATAGVAEGVEGVDEEGAGQLVFAVDLWQTADFPSADHVYEQWAMEMAQDPELRGFAEEMASAFLPDEALGVGGARNVGSAHGRRAGAGRRAHRGIRGNAAAHGDHHRLRSGRRGDGYGCASRLGAGQHGRPGTPGRGGAGPRGRAGRAPQPESRSARRRP
jgi:hypothetical protein